jgi:hypothetical protein
MSEVKTIGSKEIKTDEQKQEELKQQKIAEAQEKVKKIAENEVKRRFRTPFLQVYDEVVNKNKTIEGLIEEVNQKKSRMTKFGRDYVTEFEPDRIRQWIEDEKKGEYYYRVK